MERLMTLDEEDIIKLIAKSVGVRRQNVKLKLSAETFLADMDSMDNSSDDISDACFVDASFRLCAKIELPMTQIDGTEVSGYDEYTDDGDENDDRD